MQPATGSSSIPLRSASTKQGLSELMHCMKYLSLKDLSGFIDFESSSNAVSVPSSQNFQCSKSYAAFIAWVILLSVSSSSKHEN